MNNSRVPMKRWHAAVVGLAAAAAIALAPAPRAAADVLVTVTPTTNLTNGQAVSIFADSGRTVSTSLVADLAHVNLCANTGATGVQCKDIGTLAPDVRQTASRNEYVWDGSVNVASSFTPPAGNVSCAAQCFLRISGSFNNGAGGTISIGSDIPLSFTAPK